MPPDFDSMEPFCRVNVQADVGHSEFVDQVARWAGGTRSANSVRSATLDISVDENDVFDSERSHTGKDRWLYFRYTLAIDPVGGVAPKDYVASVGSLLRTLWCSGMDAVAACEFEDHLPKNERRTKWVTS